MRRLKLVNTTDTERVFNPNTHLIQIKSGQSSKDYLPVQWRIVWFRSLFPQGTIETKMLQLDLDRDTEEEAFVWNPEKKRSEKTIKHAKGYCVFYAVIKDGVGGMATGTKSEKAASFPDFIEKSETGAIGRALAGLGFGTQFTGDEFEEAHRIVDAPVDRSASISNPQSTARSTNQPRTNEASTDASPEQITAIKKLCIRLEKPIPEQAITNPDAAQMIRDLTTELRALQSSAKN
jgi:hypothetical protein